jgi:endonuclease/exonuclease/phosphatase family metal-dependent hydrolase
MVIAIAVGFSILIAILVIVALKTPAENYIDPAGPIYIGSYATEQNSFKGRLKVISWNLNFARQIDEAIHALQNADELRDADIILLQEMDETGIEKIAQSLGYNYVYYPAAIHRRHNRLFGNAILSKWPLSDPKKIILSSSFGGLKHNRIAVRTQIDIDAIRMAAYSVHLDMIWMLPGQNNTQLDVLVSEVGKENGAAVVGGDFNSWSSGSIKMLDERFGAIGLLRVSQGTGNTLETFGGLKLATDHIFASDGKAHEAGAWHNYDISDHAAVWTIIEFEEVELNE